VRRANPTDQTADDLTDAIAHSGNIFQRVKQTHEATLDSRFLIITAETAAAMARSMRIDKSAFDTDDFVSKLKRFLSLRPGAAAADEDEADSDAEEEDEGEADKAKRRAKAWTKMGRLALKYNHRAPTCDFMCARLARFSTT
jgi:hypothetical protein